MTKFEKSKVSHTYRRKFKACLCELSIIFHLIYCCKWIFDIDFYPDSFHTYIREKSGFSVPENKLKKHLQKQKI